MKKHSLIHAGVAKDNPHQYNVVIGTELGQFSGTVECRPEDEEYESKFFGFELAEMKAEIEYARAKRKECLAKIKGVTEFWREMAETRNYDQDAFWVKKMREKVDKYQLQFEFWCERIDYLKSAYHLKIMNFDNAKRTRKEFGL